MRQALDIALKDLRRTYRDVPALAMMLAAPLAIALLLGAAFGGSGDFSIRPVKTVVADLDRGAAAGSSGQPGAAAAGPDLIQVLGDEGLASLIDLTVVNTEAEARAAVDDGKAVVAVVQPQGLIAAAASPQTAGADFLVYRDPTSSLGPGIVTGIVRRYADGLNSARAAAGAAVELGLSSGGLTPDQIAPVAAAAAHEFAVRTDSAGVRTHLERPRTAGGVAPSRRGMWASPVRCSPA